MQICKDFGLDPLDYFTGSRWKNDEGLAMKQLLLAFHQLNAEESKRIQDGMDKKTNQQGR